jgi:uncharacterized repeat protein (TIGR01451 family)
VSNRIRRSFVSLSIAALCASFLVLGGDRASANKDCDQIAPTADVSVTQTISPVVDSTGNLLKTITLTNHGPCNVPDVSLIDTLPAGSTVVLPITTTPSDWSCDTTVSGTVSCTRTSAMGIPGTSTIQIRITAPTASEWADVATATVGLPTDPPGSTVDPILTNNTSWGAYVTADGSLKACTNPSQGNGSGCDQSTAVAATGAAGSAEVQLNAKTCADLSSQFPNCFGQLMSVNSAITNALKTLTVNAAAAHGAFGGVQVIRTTDGTTWSVVPNCSKTITTDCVQAKTKFKVNGVTYYQFVVRTLNDDGWGFDG